MQILAFYKKAKALYEKYESRVGPAAFFVGFILDNLTLRRIDLWFQNVIFLLYLGLGAASIVFTNFHDAKRLGGRMTNKLAGFMPFVMRFVFGGLFSAFLVFYTRSASIFVSWPFLLFLTALFIGNEFFKKRYLRFTFQLSIFFIALFSYSAFVIPVLLGKMGVLIFLLSGVVALVLVGLIVAALYRMAPQKVRESRRSLLLSIGSIHVAFQLFYFTNIIPPIPLSLRESGIYHSIERMDMGKYMYAVSFEQPPWYLFFEDVHDTFHLTPGGTVYSYSAVFAPTKLDTTILHRWSYFDEGKGKWIETDRLPLAIVGGRDGGYRGYTFKRSMKPGKWRLDVITKRGQILGRRTFTIVASAIPPKVKTDFR